MAEFIEERLSAIAGVAKIVDQSMDLVEAGITRLSKSLAGTDDEAKGAGKALADLGLSAEKLRRMDSAADMRRSSGQIAREVAAAIKGTARYA